MSEKVAGKKRSRPPEDATGSDKKKGDVAELKDRKRIRLSHSDIRGMTRDDIIAKWDEQDQYIDWLVGERGLGEMERLQESENKLQQQVQEATRRENVLNMRLATKQQELQDQIAQVHDLKQVQQPANTQLHSALMDPVVNLMFQRMKNELRDTKEKLAQAQSDLSAWKFSTDSATGKKLMAKCHMLLQENQELGKQLSQGRVAQLEAEIALQKKYSQELKTAYDELSEFVFQLDEESEGLHGLLMLPQEEMVSLIGGETLTLPSLPPSSSQSPGGADSKMATGRESKSRTTTNGPTTMTETPQPLPSTSNEH